MGGGRAIRLGQTWKVAAWEIAHLVSCHFKKYATSLKLLTLKEGGGLQYFLILQPYTVFSLKGLGEQFTMWLSIYRVTELKNL